MLSAPQQSSWAAMPNNFNRRKNINPPRTHKTFSYSGRLVFSDCFALLLDGKPTGEIEWFYTFFFSLFLLRYLLCLLLFWHCIHFSLKMCLCLQIKSFWHVLNVWSKHRNKKKLKRNNDIRPFLPPLLLLLLLLVIINIMRLSDVDDWAKGGVKKKITHIEGPTPPTLFLSTPLRTL